ncbi:MmgE/PrpD family protein (plasmid) [Natrinema zhouii]|uniref:MmgE/PrpD family protein n=1 Tax=Natrinema zhouii TaxID=1710539 RepID=UPI001CFF7B3A|nr:MmgE/PrpD family protein [Natrinema zhouii]UHQ98589.1 MmgE/PrpD family protein [Natrinema zhouii]
MRSSLPEERLSEFVAGIEYDDIPAECTDTITRAFVDTIGVMIAGSSEGAGRTAAESAGIEPMDTAVETLLGIDADLPADSVALRMGTASHALDYDDLSWAMNGHPSITLVPAVLALANEADASGRDLITAYAAGFEVECAVADPVSPDHYEAGWHATATFGTFGATAAAAHLLELDETEIGHALNIAASMPSGLKRNFGSMTKPLHAGLCSRSGVTASRLSDDGFTADTAAISGDRGFWDLYSPVEWEQFSIGDRWVLEEEGINIKAYPCCYFTHTSIAAAQTLTDDGIDPADIERVSVTASPGAGDALHHANPETGLEAKFSMEYTVASAIVRDTVGLATFRDDAVDDPDVQRIRERVDFSTDDELAYDSHEASVRIHTAADTYERQQENPPGTHDDPLTDEELRFKFDECTHTVLSDAETDRLYDTLSSLSAQADVSSAIIGDR